ncbi:MAG: hypothetical protein AB1696_09335 [Planctomycetota bacterium]
MKQTRTLIAALLLAPFAAFGQAKEVVGNAAGRGWQNAPAEKQRHGAEHTPSCARATEQQTQRQQSRSLRPPLRPHGKAVLDAGGPILCTKRRLQPVC